MLKPAKPIDVEALQAGLDALYPEPRCGLDFVDPFQLLVATVLSAQTTDVKVNQTTPALFARWPDAAALAQAVPEEIVPFLRSLGLFNNKAKALAGIGRLLVRDHGGQVPASLEALIALPGVARKTANVVLQNAWDITEGFVVDTHVKRLAGRLGLSRAARVDRIEVDLCERLPKDAWRRLSHQLVAHGRRTCKARRPRCESCTLAPLCPSSPA